MERKRDEDRKVEINDKNDRLQIGKSKKQAIMEKFYQKKEKPQLSSQKEEELRSKKIELSDFKRHVWACWRDGNTPWNRRKISTNIREADERRNEMRKKLAEEREQTEEERRMEIKMENEERKERKKRVSELVKHWEMIRELTKAIEEDDEE